MPSCCAPSGCTPSAACASPGVGVDWRGVAAASCVGAGVRGDGSGVTVGHAPRSRCCVTRKQPSACSTAASTMRTSYGSPASPA